LPENSEFYSNRALREKKKNVLDVIAIPSRSANIRADQPFKLISN